MTQLAAVFGHIAYRSKKNAKHLRKAGLKPAMRRKKPRGKPIPERVAKTSGAKSKVRAALEHVFAWEKGPGSSNSEFAFRSVL